jgi:polar amino acid transport system substrate-binding protein
MMSRRLLRYTLCVAVALPALAACANDKPAAANPYNLLTPGVIAAGALSENPPFAFAAANGKPQGFAIDLAEEVAKRLRVRIEYQSTTIQGLLTGLAAGKYDIGAGGVGATAERKQAVDFIKPYYWGFTAVVTRTTSTATSIADFNGKRIGVTTGAVQEAFLTNKMPKALPVKFQDPHAGIAQLLAGTIDGFVVGGADAEEYLAQEKTLKIAVSEESTQGTAFPVKKGNTALVNALDTKIDEMIADGTFIKLYQKWFTRPLSHRVVEFRPGLAAATGSAAPSRSA